MGWREFCGWLAAMNRQVEGERPSPDSWRVADPWFDEMKRARREGRL